MNLVLFLDQLLQHPTQLRKCIVEGDWHLLGIGGEFQAFGLGLDHQAVFFECHSSDGDHPVSQLLTAASQGMAIRRPGEEVARRVFATRGNGLAGHIMGDRIHAMGLLTFELLQCSLREAVRTHHHDTRHQVVVGAEQVHRLAIHHILDVVRNRLIWQPALNSHAPLQTGHFRPHMRPIAAHTEAFRVKEEKVREVQQVVVNQLVIGVVLDVAGAEDPVRVIQSYCRRNQGRVSLGRIAHPYPDPTVLLDYRETADASLRRNGVLPRHFHTGTCAVELQSVVHATHGVAFLTTDGKRCGTMAAAVLQCSNAAVGLAEEHDGLIDDGAGKQSFRLDLVVPGGYIQQLCRYMGVLLSGLCCCFVVYATAHPE
ncbi:hypothetical protein FQZ97_818160 [compost metagenome]